MPVCMHIYRLWERPLILESYFTSLTMSTQCRRMWQIFRSLFVIFDVVQVPVWRKHPINDIIISKFSSASISKRKMVLDTDCLNILIFMICILSVNQSNISFVLYGTVGARSRSDIYIYIHISIYQIFDLTKDNSIQKIPSIRDELKMEVLPAETGLSELMELVEWFDLNPDTRKCLVSFFCGQQNAGIILF